MKTSLQNLLKNNRDVLRIVKNMVCEVAVKRQKVVLKIENKIVVNSKLFLPTR